MHDGEDNRARQTRLTPELGEPERWGGSVVWQPTLDAGPIVATTRPQTSQQIIRIQQPNLLARSWDLFCQFDVEGYSYTGGNRFAIFGLEVTTGAGQSTGLGILVLASDNPGRQVDGEFAHAGLQQDHPQGATQATFALPGTALNIRGFLIGASGVAAPAPLTVSLTVIVAPRALV